MAGPFYVRTDGNDADTGLSWGNGWKTIQKLADTAVVGEIGYIAGDDGTYGTGLYTLAAQIDFDINSGTLASPIQYIATNGVVKIDGNSAVNKCINGRTTFLHFDVNDPTTDAWEIYGSRGVGFSWQVHQPVFLLRNMVFRNNGSAGLYIYRRPRGRIINCIAYSNNQHGFFFNQAYNYGWNVIGCEAYDNGVDGFYHGALNLMEYCSSHHNGGNGYHFYTGGTSGKGATMKNCIASNNDGDGIKFDVVTTLNGFGFITNSIISDNGGFGITCLAGQDDAIYLDSNCYFNNTLGDVNNVTKGYKSINSDPLFTDRVNADYTLQSGSPCIGTGIPNDYNIVSNGNVGQYQQLAGGAGSSGYSRLSRFRGRTIT